MDLIITVQDHLEPRVMRSSLVVEEGQAAVFHPRAFTQGPDGIEIREHALEVRAHRVSRPSPGFLLKDARHLGVVRGSNRVSHVCRIPSTRSLADIMQDVVQHGLENPAHGTDCVCMDKFVGELTAHVIRHIPDAEWEMQFNARLRIGHVLRRLGSKL